MTNNINEQYWKTDEPAFQTRLNIKILSGPKKQSFYKWIFQMIKWIIDTRQDLISRNLWQGIDVADYQEITMMPMHQKSPWNNNKNKQTNKPH
jgi:hypothetical protein